MSKNDQYNKPGFWTFIVILTANILYFVYLSFFGTGVKDYNKPVPGQESSQTK
ncbi:hypothetical protein [Leptospira perolatii]|uniref:hypothetical protein n=1 Tax=Leptospira perolatii TaxID=2023191 RepID=UPI0013FDC3CD|nr:hypothetical protein [Leptospira perolatii]